MDKYNYNNKCGQEIFRDILAGKARRFPNGFWQQPGIEGECAAITRYFIEEILEWEDKDIKEKTCEMIFRKYHLSGMLEYVFGRSPFLAINNAYPGRYRVWELTCTPKHFWEEEKNRNSALSWLLDKTGKTKICELTNKDFLNNGLGGLMDYLKRYSIYENLNRNEIEHKKIRNETEIKISFSKINRSNGRSKVRARMEIPEEMLKEIGITEKNNVVTLSLDSENMSIIIKKVNTSGEMCVKV